MNSQLNFLRFQALSGFCFRTKKTLKFAIDHKNQDKFFRVKNSQRIVFPNNYFQFAEQRRKMFTFTSSFFQLLVALFFASFFVVILDNGFFKLKGRAWNMKARIVRNCPCWPSYKWLNVLYTQFFQFPFYKRQKNASCDSGITKMAFTSTFNRKKIRRHYSFNSMSDAGMCSANSISACKWFHISRRKLISK